jgi:hypothetical protein
LERLVQLGRLQAARATAIWAEFEAREASPGVLMATPAVLEIIAARTR